MKIGNPRGLALFLEIVAAPAAKPGSGAICLTPDFLPIGLSEKRRSDRRSGLVGAAGFPKPPCLLLGDESDT
jgi:hypothetical protein